MSRAILVFVLSGVILTGCAPFTAKDNFASFLNHDIGLTGDDWSRDLVDTRALPDGNKENKYVYLNTRGRCVFYREIDQKTNRMIAWQIEGDDTGCAIPS